MNRPNRLTDGPWMPIPPSPLLRAARRLAVVAAVSAVALGLLVAFHRPILVSYARFLEIDEPMESDLIVLLMGGPDHRPAKAAEFWRLGLAPRIVFGSSGLALAELTDETKLTMSVLLREGVPESAIVRLPDRVTSTRDEARAVAAYLAGRPARRILVVSSGFHTRRARWIFERELAGLGVEVRTAAAHAPDDPGDDWYRTDEGLILYFIESIKLLAYRILY